MASDDEFDHTISTNEDTFWQEAWWTDKIARRPSGGLVWLHVVSMRGQDGFWIVCWSGISNVNVLAGPIATLDEAKELYRTMIALGEY